MLRPTCVLMGHFVLLFGLTTLASGQVVSGENEKQQAARKRIESVLSQTASLSVEAQSLKEVVESLASRHMIPIQIDDAALRDSAIGGSDVPITQEIKGISLRAIFNRVLGELELTHIIKDEVLLITTKEYADQMLLEKVYVVKDLAAPEKDRIDGSVGRYSFLVDLIQNITGRPEDWADVGGGDGVIEAVDHLGVLAVKQTEEIHHEIESSLKNLRKAKSLAEAMSDKPQKAAKTAGPPASSQQAKESQQATESQQAKAKAPQQVLKIYHLRRWDWGNDASPARELATVVSEMIAPTTWSTQGGKGKVQAAGDALVVRQSADGHHQVRRLLLELGVLEVKTVPRASGVGGAIFSLQDGRSN